MQCTKCCKNSLFFFCHHFNATFMLLKPWFFLQELIKLLQMSDISATAAAKRNKQFENKFFLFSLKKSTSFYKFFSFILTFFLKRLKCIHFLRVKKTETENSQKKVCFSSKFHKSLYECMFGVVISNINLFIPSGRFM